MRHAVVYGARQPFGFELCSQLLEKGYVVHAVDHQHWMREEDEEKWLFIGRNANLVYYEIAREEDHAKLPFQPSNNCLIFIPVIDYVMRHVSHVADQLVRQLTYLSHMEMLEEAFVFFIYPPASRLYQAPFFKNLDSIYSNFQTNQVSVNDFFLSIEIEKESVITKEECKREVEYVLSRSEEKLVGN